MAEEQIRGRVTDEKGEELPGVSVVVKGTQRGTSTDAKGTFTIAVPDRSAVLVFSFVGYQTQEIAVGPQNQLNVSLKADLKSLEEVVVVGYGTQKKVSLTGAISSIKPTEILRSPVSSVANALAGRTTGVITVQRGGEPGRDIADIFIRGVATFAGGSSAQPLVLVDGVQRSLAGIDPYTIESFNVLKDASATAVFGVRGANGVIIITTKMGAEGTPQFTFSSNFGIQNPIRLPTMLDAVRFAEVLLNYAEAMNEAYGPEAKVSINGPTATRSALEAVNLVRVRAGQPAIPAGISQQLLRERIRNERRVELAFEEHRFFDVRRWKIAEQTENMPLRGMRVVNNAGQLSYQPFVVEQRTFTPNMYLYPIPYPEIAKSNGQLTQNPGW